MRCFFKVAVDRAARSSRRDHRPPMERRTVRPPRRSEKGLGFLVGARNHANGPGNSGIRDRRIGANACDRHLSAPGNLENEVVRGPVGR